MSAIAVIGPAIVVSTVFVLAHGRRTTSYLPPAFRLAAALLVVALGSTVARVATSTLRDERGLPLDETADASPYVPVLDAVAVAAAVSIPVLLLTALLLTLARRRVVGARARGEGVSGE